MLRDSHSYETQIIDAVRSVNRALGGTYGTSSAIYKSEFNQYEVQLIDAIKGIGRTLSGKGISGVGGGGDVDLSGYVTQTDFQAFSSQVSTELGSLSSRVTTLENESFFRLVDGNVTLKTSYSNLWVPGWLAAGGVGSGGGGGGSSYLKELLDVYHGTGGVLRADGTAVQAGDALVYNTTLGWVASQVSSGGSTVSWGTESGYTVPLTVNGTAKTLLLSGALTGYATESWVQQQGYLTSGSIYTLRTPVSSTAANGTLLGVDALSNASSSTAGSDTSRIAWDSQNSAWHVYGNLYADGWVSAGGIGSSGGGGGTGTVTSVGLTVPTGLSVSGSPITTSGTLAITLASGYTIPTTATLGNFVTLEGTQTITGTKTFSANTTFSSNVYVGGVVYVANKGMIDLSQSGMTRFGLGTRSERTFNAYGTNVTLRAYNSSGSQVNLLSVQSDVIVVNSKIIPNYMSGIDLGGNYDDQRWNTIYGVNGNLSGNLTMTSASHIDIGPLRIEYDSTNKAIHITKVNSSDTNNYGLYADGFIAAGGVQQT